MVGLSKLTDNFRVLNADNGRIRVIYDMNTETITTDGLQTTAIEIPAASIAFQSGFGNYKLILVDGFLSLEFLLELNIVSQEIKLHEFNIDLGFQNISINFDNAFFNNEPVSWDAVNQDIKFIFDEYWPQIKANIEPLLVSVFELLFKVS